MTSLADTLHRIVRDGLFLSVHRRTGIAPFADATLGNLFAACGGRLIPPLRQCFSINHIVAFDASKEMPYILE
jgi:hypothetical protein